MAGALPLAWSWTTARLGSDTYQWYEGKYFIVLLCRMKKGGSEWKSICQRRYWCDEIDYEMYLIFIHFLTWIYVYEYDIICYTLVNYKLWKLELGGTLILNNPFLFTLCCFESQRVDNNKQVSKNDLSGEATAWNCE